MEGQAPPLNSHLFACDLTPIMRTPRIEFHPNPYGEAGQSVLFGRPLPATEFPLMP